MTTHDDAHGSRPSSASSLEMVEDDEEENLPELNSDHNEAFLASTAPSCILDCNGDPSLDQTTRSFGRAMAMLPLPVKARPLPSAQFVPSPLPESLAASPIHDGDSAGGGGSSDDGDEEQGPDRIGAFFGYNGKDTMVPKAAYDASLHRIATLEQRLGTANREVRTLTEQSEKQANEIADLQRTLADAQLRVAELEAREETLRAKERKLDALAKALAGKVTDAPGVIASNGRIATGFMDAEPSSLHYGGGRNRGAGDVDRPQQGFVNIRRTSIRRGAEAFGADHDRLPPAGELSSVPRLPRLNVALPQLGGGPRASSSLM